ncbi:hypothetical protein [Paenibacillus sp. MMS20-IR301]|uniref:hypothetical protein n=1 Tax=Paenibacillus sp. MMS20-IR301 TaxID=2895946 RepID=UPI0028E8DA6E|nr:hypothetical protein [Paenibacillus sp. MMS20-IR301]WNS40910.1 hypothetical protein LOS79_17840 [Paenibacillus sp. MMS20-IR301]
MGVVFILAVSILYPVLLYKMLRSIHNRSRLRIYWILVPLCLASSISIPFLYSFIKDPGVLLSLAAMIDYSVKSGFMSFLVIPSFVTSLLCAVYGYMRGSKRLIPIMSAVILAGLAGLLFSGGLINRLMYEPPIRWEKVAADEVAGAGMWIYGDAAKGERRYIDLNEQEINQVCSMLNLVQESQATEVRNDENSLVADIGISLASDRDMSVHIQYDNRNVYVKINKKRNQKQYHIESAELKAFFDYKLYRLNQ